MVKSGERDEIRFLRQVPAGRPMDMTDNSKKRLNGTEHILCMACVDSCPQKALRL